MPLRWQEVAVPLFVIVSLIVLKYVPFTAGLPLARAAGVVAFGYAAFLALRLVQSEEAASVDGWSELRPSMVEYFACYGAAALAVVLMSAIIVIGGTKHVEAAQMMATFIASLMLGAGALAIGLGGLFTRVRWNNTQLEHRNAFGRETSIAWSDVRSVRPNWRGVVIATHDRQRVTFSQFHSGAAQLAIHATNRARRNAEASAKAFATL
ncbi:MAG: PH domain-containing protein [Devosia sp.]